LNFGIAVALSTSRISSTSRAGYGYRGQKIPVTATVRKRELILDKYANFRKILCF